MHFAFLVLFITFPTNNVFVLVCVLFLVMQLYSYKWMLENNTVFICTCWIIAWL